MSNSAFLAAGFDPAGSTFAAVYQGLDAHRLRVLSLSQSGPSPQEFALAKTTKVTTLAWASQPYSDRSQQAKKRRKAGASNESSDVILLGTNQGQTLVYSPASSSITAELKSESTAPVSGFIVHETAPKVSVVQLDGTFTDFDLIRNAQTTTLTTPVADPTAIELGPNDMLIVGNTAPHLVRDREIEVTYTGFATPIRQLLSLGASHFAAIAEEDRQVLVYKYDSPKPVHSLMCPSTNASFASVSEDLSALAVTTEDGQVYVFASPTEPVVNERQTKRGRGLTQAKPCFSIEVVTKGQLNPLVVSQCRFVDDFLQLVWPEQGSVPVFDRIQWRHSSGRIFNQHARVEKSPAAPLAHEVLVGGLDPAAAPTYKEGQAKVVSGEHVADLSDDDEEEETLADRLDALEVEMRKDGHVNGGSNADAADAEDGMQAKESSSRTKKREMRSRRSEAKLKLAQPGTFATLLNQALTSNDRQLLELCLEETDADMVRSSIVKLESTLAATLLENLASMMAHDQSRSAMFTQWIRWVVVIHGAYLVTIPNLLKALASLHSTLSTRAATLPRLLALQGRLELLEAQLTIRNDGADNEDDGDDEPELYFDEDEAMIVNGEEADGDDAENADENAATEVNNVKNGSFSSGDDEIRFVDDEAMLSDE